MLARLDLLSSQALEDVRAKNSCSLKGFCKVKRHLANVGLLL